MFNNAPIRALLACCCLVVLPQHLAHAAGAGAHLPVLNQAAELPEGFEEHFFDVPLAMRIEVDGRFLGDALGIVSRDETVRLLSFTDTQDSTVPEAERGLWTQALAGDTPLGTCTRNCPNGLIAIHYQLEDSQLFILTENVERGAAPARYHSLPDGGSYGLVVQNQLNVAAGDGENAGRYYLQGSASLGNWSQTATAQLAKTGEPGTPVYHSINELYTQRELQGQFFRLGYFTPDALGLYRRPRQFGGSPDTTLGLMYGSSDSLAIDTASPSTYPVYVTPARAGVVEIYRNGVLVDSQAVQAGLQAIDTRKLPSGIYPVDVRLIEDGIVTSSTEEVIYKPSNWRNADQRWRYNLYAGRAVQLLNNWGDGDPQGNTLGAMVNYLAHPRVVLGLSAQRIAEKNQLGTSIDWSLSDRASVYANVYQTRQLGTGIDLQSMYQYGSGSLSFSHNRSWLDTRRTYDYFNGVAVRRRNPYNGQTQTSSFSLNQRLSMDSSVNARIAHSAGNVQGVSMDLSWLRNGKLFGSAANWRVSLFDRPATVTTGSQRNRGIELGINMALGGAGSNISASLGTRTGPDGSRDLNASLGYQHSNEEGLLRGYSANVTADVYGTGLSGQAYFQTDQLNGDLYAQRSSYNDALSGGLNLDSTVAFGGGQVAASGRYYGSQAAMIVDVDSDLPSLTLRADDLGGGHSGMLKPGRNLIPVGAFKSGAVQFDFDSTAAHAAHIQPSLSRYHLNKGAVQYQRLRVFKTVSVLGRLLDPQGRPLRGARIQNHASSSVTEADGFFVLEMSESTPTLEVSHGGQPACTIVLDPSAHRRENDVLMVADLTCRADTPTVARQEG
ncbi:TcfC E-set like domain-containing protein [Pseudomonas sp. RIT-PI-S]|uniref:TcfC E-set like domain-containing protein n=1 Tax=Pseudomonas sp. RIT-PI-S TaxID=3035295 RepID=UPI0021DA2CE4|nr:TcfC E-set like domain-containing protein [Pseudomonas sp. RIT-PI-S]